MGEFGCTWDYMETHWTRRQINAMSEGLVRKWGREQKEIDKAQRSAGSRNGRGRGRGQEVTRTDMFGPSGTFQIPER